MKYGTKTKEMNKKKRITTGSKENLWFKCKGGRIHVGVTTVQSKPTDRLKKDGLREGTQTPQSRWDPLILLDYIGIGQLPLFRVKK